MKLHRSCLKTGNYGNCSVQHHIQDIDIFKIPQNVFAILLIVVYYLSCSLERNIQDGACGDTSSPSTKKNAPAGQVCASTVCTTSSDFKGFGMGSLRNLPQNQHDLSLLPMPGHHKLPQAMKHWSLKQTRKIEPGNKTIVQRLEDIFPDLKGNCDFLGASYVKTSGVYSWKEISCPNVTNPHKKHTNRYYTHPHCLQYAIQSFHHKADCLKKRIRVHTIYQ